MYQLIASPFIGHHLVLKPTHGVTIGLNFGGSAIRYINVVDYIASATQPVISQTPAIDPSPSASVSFDGWVLPKAGVAFVWVLDEEMSKVAERQTEGRPRQSRRHRASLLVPQINSGVS